MPATTDSPTIEFPKPFTERERQILALLAKGKTTGEIADALGTAAKTVDHQTQYLRMKLLMPNIRQLIVYAVFWQVAEETKRMVEKAN
jgi:DNA-binding NarL/FixJ family response regulator